jgi:Flp pilus assembly protein TadG
MNLITSRHRRRHRERGQALIEFALTAPILLTLLLGLIEIGNGLNSYIKIVSVARDAARYGAQNCLGVTTSCDSAIRDQVVLQEAGSLRGNEAWVSASWGTGTGFSGNICSSSGPGVCITHFNNSCTAGVNCTAGTNAVKVRVCYDHPLLVGLPGVIPNPIRMCSASTMRVVSS